ncbi:protein Tex24-like [Rattus rattus]|uniref:protein Tex24-like n=1 Tax=Rattus rattus TaxID=10117 RepID=UPI0013F372CB|nr:protein Tex24-like [Rattus rattus]
MAGFEQKATKGKVKAVSRDASFMRSPTVTSRRGPQSALASQVNLNFSVNDGEMSSLGCQVDWIWNQAGERPVGTICVPVLDFPFLKSRRLEYVQSNERSLGQASRLAIRSNSVTQGFKDLRAAPGSRQGLGDQPHSLPNTSHGKKKPDRLPYITSYASKNHAPDPTFSLSIVSKRVFQCDSVKGPEHRRTFVGHAGLQKNSPEATAGEAQGKKRIKALLSKARKQTEKASNQVDTRQFQKQEVVMNTKCPSKKHQQQQQESPEGLKSGRLGGGDNTGLRQSRGPFRYYGCLAPPRGNTFLQSKKIKPYSRESVWIGKAKGLGQDLLAKAKPWLLKRKKMQAMEMLTKPHHHRGLCLENSRKEVKRFSQDIPQGALERNIARPKWLPREEGWDHMVQGTPVVFAVRDCT